MDFRGNAATHPDRPHRERSGWTGDWQLFLPSAAFLRRGWLSTKWLRDLAAQQRLTGSAQLRARPCRDRGLAEVGPTWFRDARVGGWGDAP